MKLEQFLDKYCIRSSEDFIMLADFSNKIRETRITLLNEEHFEIVKLVVTRGGVDYIKGYRWKTKLEQFLEEYCIQDGTGRIPYYDFYHTYIEFLGIKGEYLHGELEKNLTLITHGGHGYVHGYKLKSQIVNNDLITELKKMTEEAINADKVLERQKLLNLVTFLIAEMRIAAKQGKNSYEWWAPEYTTPQIQAIMDEFKPFNCHYDPERRSLTFQW